jgi:predicted transglutaminase-like cysteine proteinase
MSFAFAHIRFRAFCAALLAAAVVAAGALSFARAGEASASASLFGSAEKPSSDLSQFPKWTGALAQYDRERALELQRCAGKGCAVQRWRQYLSGLHGRPPLQQLEAVNRYVNQTPYQTDLARFGTIDHWATPREFLEQSGDCEDYAIAKYLSLRHLGWDVSSLRVLVLNDEVRRELHAVLIAYVDGVAYVLDNLSADVRPHTAIRHYRPIFSINEKTWYFHEGWSPAPSSPVSMPAIAPAPPAASVQAPGGARIAAPQASGPVPLRQETAAIVDLGQYSR